MNITLFALSSIGLTNLLVYGKIRDRPRAWIKSKVSAELAKGLDCYQCVGFWTGMLCGLALTTNPFHVFFAGCAGSWLSKYSNVVREYLEARRPQ